MIASEQEELQQLRRALFKLAHFDPSLEDEYGHQAMDYLVLDALAAMGPLLAATVVEMRTYIGSTFHLDFAEAELAAAARRLSIKRLVNVVGFEQPNTPTRFSITPETAEMVRRNVEGLQQLELRVIERWRTELRDRYKTHSEILTGIDAMTAYLQRFVAKLFVRHGVECVALLYPDDHRAQSWINEVEQAIFDDMPQANSALQTIMRLEVSDFFRSNDADRRVYLTNLLNSSFYLHLLQVDASCANLLREATAGQRLFLDNNVLYGLAGLDGPVALRATHYLLDTAPRLGYELWISTKTIEEFHESLRHRARQIQELPFVPTELARLAVKCLGDNSFLATYWQYLVLGGTTIQEFVAEKSHLQDLLDGLSIQVTFEMRDEIEKSQDLIDEEAILGQVASAHTNSHIINHDAFHRVLITRLRGGPVFNFHEAVAWFLTEDSKLPRYDRVARQGSSSLPFCMTTSQWMQVNRPLVTRTESDTEYEESFHQLVVQPMIRALLPTVTLDASYAAVLARLSRYNQMSPQLALSIVADRQFVVAISEAATDTAQQELIDCRLADIAVELQAQKTALSTELSEQHRQRDEIAEQLSEEETRHLQERTLLEARVTALLDESSFERDARLVAEAAVAHHQSQRKLLIGVLTDQAARRASACAWISVVIVIIVCAFILWHAAPLIQARWAGIEGVYTIVSASILVGLSLLLGLRFKLSLREAIEEWLRPKLIARRIKGIDELLSTVQDSSSEVQ